MRRNAFTLIELLVVVAIIVVLIAILVPAMERAMGLAQRTQCLANLKAIGNGIALYMQDYQRSYPATAGWGLTLGKAGTAWHYPSYDVKARPLNAYLGYTNNGSEVPVAECPNDVGDPLVAATPNYTTLGTSYQEALHNYSGVKGIFGWEWDYSNAPYRTARGADITSTHNKIVSGDYVYYGNRPLRNRLTRWHQLDYKDSVPPGQQTRQHNILLADGHAETHYFDNALIDNEVDGTNWRRVPNPSHDWW